MSIFPVFPVFPVQWGPCRRYLGGVEQDAGGQVGEDVQQHRVGHHLPQTAAPLVLRRHDVRHPGRRGGCQRENRKNCHIFNLISIFFFFLKFHIYIFLYLFHFFKFLTKTL